MYSNFYNEKNDFFSIIVASLLFHFLIIAALLIVIWLKPKKENPPPIPFFEMVNVAPPPPAQRQKTEPIPEAIPEPVPEVPPEPVPVKETPVPKPELKPELKPEPEPTPKPVTKPTVPVPTPVPPAPSMDMPMDLPSNIKSKDTVKSKDMDMLALGTSEDIIRDNPQLPAYLNLLKMLISQNFNPPAGTEIAGGTRSRVQFQITRNGQISEVVLRSSSGNSIWDRLAVRAVQITKPPPLPPSFTDENLPLFLDFREK